MDISNQILSDIVVFNKYAKFMPEKGRRETFSEICNRYQDMMITKHPNIAKDIKEAMKFEFAMRNMPYKTLMYRKSI